MPLIWSLLGQTTTPAIELFSKAINDKDQYTRWAAATGLSGVGTRGASYLLVAALKDRSHLVKGAAVDAMLKFRDPAAVPQLKKIIESEYLQKNAPGIVSSARKALRVCNNAR
jgi:HEAT repeat protein